MLHKLQDVFESFERHEVRYVVIGGIAARTFERWRPAAKTRADDGLVSPSATGFWTAGLRDSSVDRG